MAYYFSFEGNLEVSKKTPTKTPIKRLKTTLE
jgi:hypothetical protein